MNGMSVDVPEMEELLRPVPVARYGDDADGAARGGALHLSSLLPALACAIGHPTPTAVHRDPDEAHRKLGLPEVESAVVVLIDGLGYWNLAMRLGHAPYLRSLMNEPANQRPISTCAPSTTVAAMSTFGTGTCPGLTGMTGYTQRNPETGELAQMIQFRQAIAAPSTTVAAMSTFGTGTCPGLTGMTGYTQRNPETGELAQMIQFRQAIAPRDLQRQPTVFELLRDRGVRVTSSGLPKFAASPLTEAALRGTDYISNPRDLQRQPTVFELLRDRGVRVTSSGLPKFAASPLTEAALRGTDYISNVAPRDRVLAAADAACAPGLTYLYIRDADKIGHTYGWDSDKWIGTFERIDAQLALLRRSVPSAPGLTYLYIRDADKIGHTYGWDSDKWIGTFERIDAQLALLRRSVPKGTLIVITADHGMVSSDPQRRIDIAVTPQLARGVAMVGGEPRSVMLYAQEGEDPEDIADRWREFLGDGAQVRSVMLYAQEGEDPEDIADRWREFLGDGAQVRTRAQALAEGLFGPVEPRVEPMIGDVLVSAVGSLTMVDSRMQTTQAMQLPSVHGAHTMLEMDIPCLIDLA